MIDLNNFYHSEFEEHKKVTSDTYRAVQEPFVRLVNHCVASIQRGGKILFFGNGGSAADSQHLATELTIRYKTNRAPIAALALTTDTSALTACGNDLGFDYLFSRQIEALGKPGDIAVGITTSGQSKNVTLALQKAKEMGMVAAAFGGKDGGTLVGLADPLLIVPTYTASRAQEMHIMLGQMLCGALEQKLGLV